jgi:hypothetical protein
VPYVVPPPSPRSPRSLVLPRFPRSLVPPRFPRDLWFPRGYPAVFDATVVFGTVCWFHCGFRGRWCHYGLWHGVLVHRGFHGLRCVYWFNRGLLRVQPTVFAATAVLRCAALGDGHLASCGAPPGICNFEWSGLRNTAQHMAQLRT